MVPCNAFQRCPHALWLLAALWIVCSYSLAAAAEPAPAGTEGDKPAADAKPATPASDQAPAPADPPGWQRLQEDGGIWIDKENRRLVVDGVICRRGGELEMFACLKQTKEHESIVSLATKAQTIHAGLLAVGAVAGNPAQFLPEYKPATGSEIAITVEWTDQDGTHQTDARKWLRNVSTNKQLEQNWVFGGSGFWTDPMTGARYYLAEDGDVICVSNFPSALLDLPIESPHANEALLFEAFTDRIPPVGTKVRLYLEPRAKQPPKP